MKDLQKVIDKLSPDDLITIRNCVQKRIAEVARQEMSSILSNVNEGEKHIIHLMVSDYQQYQGMRKPQEYYYTLSNQAQKDVRNNLCGAKAAQIINTIKKFAYPLDK